MGALFHRLERKAASTGEAASSAILNALPRIGSSPQNLGTNLPLPRVRAIENGTLALLPFSKDLLRGLVGGYGGSRASRANAELPT